jgi:putative transposase
MGMSQVFSIRRVKHTGAPVYLGHDDTTDTELFSCHPGRIMDWLCDGYRFRFNQHRALRKKGIRVDDPDQPGHRIPLRDSSGAKVLTTIGTDPVGVSDKEARLRDPHLAALPMQVLQHPARVENTEWWAATKRRRTLTDKKRPAGAMPRFRSAKRGDKRFGIWFKGGRNATVHRTGKKSGVLIITGQNPPGHRQSGSPRWKVKITLRLSADVLPYTSVQVDWAAKRVTFISPAPDRTHEHTGAVVGVDRGVVHTAATSDGAYFDMPTTTAVERKKKAHQKAMARSKTVAEAEGRNWRASTRRGSIGGWRPSAPAHWLVSGMTSLNKSPTDLCLITMSSPLKTST